MGLTLSNRWSQTSPATTVSVSKKPISSEERLRKTYIGLFEEMQFRASKNAMMNYYEAESLDEKGRNSKMFAHGATAMSSAGVLSGILKKGRMLASKGGLAGVAVFPICASVEIFTNCSSQFLPSYQERAKKHVQAAAEWSRISERARTARLRILADKKCSMHQFVILHDEILLEKQDVCKLVVIPREVHIEFDANHERVWASIKRRKENFKQFKKYKYVEKKEVSDEDDGDDDEFYYL